MTINAQNQNKTNKIINSAQTAKTGFDMLDKLKSNSAMERINGMADIAKMIAMLMA